MNKSILKIIVLLSIFLGVVSGMLTIVPYVGEIIFWVLITVSAPVVILFMTKQNILEVYTVRQSVVIGSLIGFAAFLAFCAVYIPAVILIAKFFNYSSNYGVTMFLANASFWLIVLISIFMAVLSATINAFSGFVTFYLIEFTKSLNNPDRDYEKFDIRK